MFKPGDKVICIDNKNSSTHSLGEIYTVENVTTIFGDIIIAETGYAYFAHRFEPTKIKEDKMKKTFKDVGVANIWLADAKQKLDAAVAQIEVCEKWIKENTITIDDIYPGSVFECKATKEIGIVSDACYNGNTDNPRYVLTGCRDNPNQAWSAKGGLVFTESQLLDYLSYNWIRRTDLECTIVSKV